MSSAALARNTFRPLLMHGRSVLINAFTSDKSGLSLLEKSMRLGTQSHIRPYRAGIFIFSILSFRIKADGLDCTQRKGKIVVTDLVLVYAKYASVLSAQSNSAHVLGERPDFPIAPIGSHIVAREHANRRSDSQRCRDCIRPIFCRGQSTDGPATRPPGCRVLPTHSGVAGVGTEQTRPPSGSLAAADRLTDDS